MNKLLALSVILIASSAQAFQYREYQIIQPPYMQHQNVSPVPLYQPAPSTTTVYQPVQQSAPVAQPAPTYQVISPLPETPYWMRGEVDSYPEE